MPRVADVYAALPSITGKMELEYEGELQGADPIARDLIAAAAANSSTAWVARRSRTCWTRWWSISTRGGVLQIADTAAARLPRGLSRPVPGCWA